MAETTAIQWADATFNPWIGCTKVSEGCKNCYAEELMDRRYHRVQWGAGKPRSRTAPATWEQVTAWNNKAMMTGRRRRVFCSSLADVFDAEVPTEWRVDLFNLIWRTMWLDWLLLTKRPENVRPMLSSILIDGKPALERMPLPNVWLGTSVESADYLCRIGTILEVPATVHFCSAEPLLGSLLDSSGMLQSYLQGAAGRPKLDWIIPGGESGGAARDCNVRWVREIVNTCWVTGACCFVKQLGASPVDFDDLAGAEGAEKLSLPLTHHKGGEMNEWPEDLRVRQVPSPPIWESKS